jgi:predicted kinase
MEALGINLWDSEARRRIENLQWVFAQQVLRHGRSVVIEWGTWGRSERDTLRIGAQKLGAAVELHFLDVPVDVLFNRIQLRNAETPAITLEDIRAWSQEFERPSFEEMALFDRSSTQPLDESVEGSWSLAAGLAAFLNLLISDHFETVSRQSLPVLRRFHALCPPSTPDFSASALSQTGQFSTSTRWATIRSLMAFKTYVIYRPRYRRFIPASPKLRLQSNPLYNPNKRRENCSKPGPSSRV